MTTQQLRNLSSLVEAYLLINQDVIEPEQEDALDDLRTALGKELKLTEKWGREYKIGDKVITKVFPEEVEILDIVDDDYIVVRHPHEVGRTERIYFGLTPFEVVRQHEIF